LFGDFFAYFWLIRKERRYNHLHLPSALFHFPLCPLPLPYT
jgi:hypothetical protein